MDEELLLRGIEAMQQIQMHNPPSSPRWHRADEVLRKLVGQLNGVDITPDMWERGETK